MHSLYKLINLLIIVNIALNSVHNIFHIMVIDTVIYVIFYHVFFSNMIFYNSFMRSDPCKVILKFIYIFFPSFYFRIVQTISLNCSIPIDQIYHNYFEIFSITSNLCFLVIVTSAYIRLDNLNLGCILLWILISERSDSYKYYKFTTNHIYSIFNIHILNSIYIHTY